MRDCSRLECECHPGPKCVCVRAFFCGCMLFKLEALHCCGDGNCDPMSTPECLFLLLIDGWMDGWMDFVHCLVAAFGGPVGHGVQERCPACVGHARRWVPMIRALPLCPQPHITPRCDSLPPCGTDWERGACMSHAGGGGGGGCGGGGGPLPLWGLAITLKLPPPPYTHARAARTHSR